MGRFEAPPLTRTSAGNVVRPRAKSSSSGLGIVAGVVGFIVAFVIAAIAVNGKFGKPKWQPYTGSDAFQVTFPSSVKQETQRVETAAGPVSVKSWTSELRDEAFIIGYTDYPSGAVTRVDLETLYNGARDGALKNAHGTLLAEASIMLDGHRGRMVSASSTVSTTNDAHTAMHLFLIGNRLWVASFTERVDSSGETKHPGDEAKFFDSFHPAS